MNHAREMLVGLGAKLRPPADSVVLDHVTAKLGITLPADGRTLYELANGSEGEFGKWLWHFWPIDSEELTLGSYLKRTLEFVVSPNHRKIDPGKYVRFFDCLIDAPLYVYCADPDSPYFGEVIGCTTDGGTFDAFISASSISRFLEMLVATHGDEIILVDEANDQPGGTDDAGTSPLRA